MKHLTLFIILTILAITLACEQIPLNVQKESIPKTYLPKEKLIEAIQTIIDKDGNNADLNVINTSDYNDMSYLFLNFPDFNGKISNWDVSNVTTMEGMFYGSNFNSGINDWNVSNVTNMKRMFKNSQFNQDISKWTPKNVTTTREMFYGASKFNQDVSNIASEKNTDSSYMFYNASAYNKPLNWTELHTTAIKEASGMFLNTALTNTPTWYNSLPKYCDNTATKVITEVTSREDLKAKLQTIDPYCIDITKITDLSGNSTTNESYIFIKQFNGNITEWDTTKVTTLQYTFATLEAFNQDISKWNVINVTTLEGTFKKTTMFNQNISNWSVQNVTNIRSILEETTNFYQDLSSWKTKYKSTPTNSSAVAFSGIINKPEWYPF